MCDITYLLCKLFWKNYFQIKCSSIPIPEYMVVGFFLVRKDNEYF